MIHQQQRFLESLDAKERQRSLIITSLPEDRDDLGATDDEKVMNVMNAVSPTEAVDRTGWIVRRLAQQNERKMTPIHVTVGDQNQRDRILHAAKKLKNAGGQMSRVYIKKDVHLAIRRETARLQKREREERQKAENAGVNITYDWKNRVLPRDGVIIDSFTPRFFWVQAER